MFNVGDTVRISPISMIINPQGYQKFKDTTGTVVDVGFMKSLVEFKDTTYYPYEWFYDRQLKYLAKLTKSEKFIFTHTQIILIVHLIYLTYIQLLNLTIIMKM